MRLPLKSLKLRMAVASALITVLLLVANAVFLSLTRRSELRRDTEEGAIRFAHLTLGTIGSALQGGEPSGGAKLRDLIREELNLDRDVERILVADVNGKVLFDSTELPGNSALGDGHMDGFVRDPARLEAIRAGELGYLSGRNAAGVETLEIIAPFIQDGGEHRLSVVYTVSYKNLRPRLARLIYATAGLTLLSILASAVVAVAFASRITRPLKELTAGAQHIADGHFERRLFIRSNDELEILAEAFNDMTERLKENVEQLEESNKKLAAVNEELKELDRMKSDFLANVSHELRTPLTAIRGYTDYLLERKLGGINEKQEKGLVVVHRNLDRLSKSINDLLDFSRMDIGRITLNIQPFSLPLLLEQLLTTVQSELDKKHLRFRTEIDANLAPVIGDREKILQVLENLVINAIKFTLEGGSITVGAIRSNPSGRPSVDISVVDTGVGIPKSQLGKIFNRFHQVDGSTTRRFGGVGLGLAIVKSILDAHGTLVAVHSEEGLGTRFAFSLPVLEKVDARPPARSGIVSALVLGDWEIVRILKPHLESEGVAIISASSAQQGAQLMLTRRPDLILWDSLAVDFGNPELFKALLEDSQSRNTPVIAVLGRTDELVGVALSPAEYLSRPLDEARVRAVARQALDNSQTEEATALVIEDQRETAATLANLLHQEGVRTLVVRDADHGLGLLEKERPKLMFLDLSTPWGLGFLRVMRANPAWASVPLVILLWNHDGEKRGPDATPSAKPLWQGSAHPPRVAKLLSELRRYLPLKPRSEEGQARTNL